MKKLLLLLAICLLLPSGVQATGLDFDPARPYGTDTISKLDDYLRETRLDVLNFGIEEHQTTGKHKIPSRTTSGLVGETPTAGRLIYNTTIGALLYGSGTAWINTNGSTSVPFSDIATYSGDLTAALAALGTTDRATLIIARTATISAHTTVPPNIELWFIGTGKISLGTYNLTLSGTITACRNQIFEYLGAGRVLRGTTDIAQVHPEWWGAAADGSTNDYPAFALALAYLGVTYDSAIDLAPGKVYLIKDNLLTIPAAVDVIFNDGARIKLLNHNVAFYRQIQAPSRPLFTYTGTGYAVTGTAGMTCNTVWFPTPLPDAISFADGRETTINVTATSITLDCTVPTTATLKVEKGNIIGIATTKTLTLNGPLDAGLYQVFSCTGTGRVVFGTSALQVSPEWWYAGGGDWTTSVQAAVDSKTAGAVLINQSMAVSSIIAKSNVNLLGTGTLTPTTQALTYMVDVSGKSNIRIQGITFSGGGAWTSTPFAHPGGGGNSVGFTNDVTGVFAFTEATNIRVEGSTFTGLEHGVWGCFKDSKITNNYFTNLGMSAIALNYSNGVDVTGNNINGVHGNLTAAGDTTVANSKFADGVMFLNCIRCTLTGGVIQDIKRIGTVFEGEGGPPLNDTITVSGVSYFNMNSCRGTEFNAAVWGEYTRSNATLTITGCTMNNTGATVGANAPRGINLEKGTVTGNSITGFSVGLACGGSVDVTASGNTVANCQVGISAATLTTGSVFNINGNKITNNTLYGIQFYDGTGYLFISGNVLRDNGSGLTLGSPSKIGGAGIFFRTDSTGSFMSIIGNTFISSANQAATTGQLYGIELFASGGGSSPINQSTISSNQFIFTGTFSSVWPANLGVLPLALGYDGGGGVVLAFDIVTTWGNSSTKAISRTSPLDNIAGYQRDLGYATAAPIAGDFKQGDVLKNSNPTTGVYMGWICTVTGSPGTWKGFGLIE
jgi:hypothetical protein